MPIDESKYDIVTLPNGNKVAFEPGTSEADVNTYLEENFSDQLGSANDPNEPTWGSSSSTDPDETPGRLDRFASSLSAEMSRSFSTLNPGVQGYYAAATGDEELLQEQAQEFRDIGERVEKMNPNRATAAGVMEAYREDGLGEAVDQAFDFTAQETGSMIGSSGIPMGIIAAGTYTANPYLIAGGTILLLGQHVAESIEGAMHNGETSAEDINLARVTLAAGGNTVLDRASFGVTGLGKPGRKAVLEALEASKKADSKWFRGAAKEVIKARQLARAEAAKAALATAAGRTGVESAKAAAKVAALSTLSEAGTEVLQTMNDKWAAEDGFLPQDDEDWAELNEVFWASLVGSAPFGGAGAYREGTAGKRERARITDEAEADARRLEAKIADDERHQARAGFEEQRTQDNRAKVHQDMSVEAQLEDVQNQAIADEVARQEAEGLRAIARTPEDIINVAADRKIDLGSTPEARAAFAAFVHRTIGTMNFAAANNAEKEAVYQALSALEPEERTTLPLATTTEAHRIASELQKLRKELDEDQLRERVAREIGKDEGQVYAEDGHLELRANAVIEKMRKGGMLVRTNEVKNGVHKITYKAEIEASDFLAQKDVAGLASQLLEDASRSVRVGQRADGSDFDIVGEVPTYQQAVAKLGRISREAYRKTITALVKRRVIEKRGPRYFYKDVDEVLRTRREYSRSKTPVKRWIVSDKNGRIAHIANSGGDARTFVEGNAGLGLQAPALVKGHLLRAAEYHDEEGKAPRLMRNVPLRFVPTDDTNSTLEIDDLLAEYESGDAAIRKEFLGNKDGQVQSQSFSETAQLARSAVETDRQEAEARLRRNPYEKDRVILKYALPDMNPTATEVVNLDPKAERNVSFDILGEQSKVTVPVVVMEGDLTAEGRGFGKKRMDSQYADWNDRLTAALEKLSDPKALERGDVTVYPRDAGRVILAHGKGDTANHFVLDYVADGDQGAFHVYNHFEGKDSFAENAEDMSPLRGFDPISGEGVWPETIRALYDPSTPKPTLAERLEFQDASNRTSQTILNADRLTALAKPKKGYFRSIADAIDDTTGYKVFERFRTEAVDQWRPAEISEERLRHADTGSQLHAEVSAVTAARDSEKAADKTSKSMAYGFLEWVAPENVAGINEGQGKAIVKDFELENTTAELKSWDQKEQRYVMKTYEAPGMFSEETQNATGGEERIILTLGEEDNALMEDYMAHRRASNLREAMIADGKEPIVPSTVEEEQAAMQILDRNPRVAVAVHNMDLLNAKAVQFGIDTGSISQADADKWLANSDYFSFYVDWEGDNGISYSEKHMREREAAKIPPRMLGDMMLRPDVKKYKGVSRKAQEQTTRERLKDPIENRYRNRQAMIHAGLVNVARARVIRNELALRTARPWNDFAAKARGSNKVTVKEDGVKVDYEVDDEMIFTMLQGSIDDFDQEKLFHNKLFRDIMTGPSTFLRETVTKSIDFVFPNTIRDYSQYYLMNGLSWRDLSDDLKNATLHGYNIVTTREGNKKIVPKKNRYDPKNLLSMQAETTGTDNVGAVRGAEQMSKSLRHRLATGKEGKGGVVGELWRKLGHISAQSESITRERAFIDTVRTRTAQLEAEGKYAGKALTAVAHMEALEQQREILNFNRHGRNRAIRMMMATIPFMNAGIQGIDVVARMAFKYGDSGINRTLDRDTKQKLLFKRMAVIGTMLFLAELAKLEDDEYEDISAETRNNNFVIPTPIDGFYLKAPAPHTVSPFMKLGPEFMARALNSTLKNETNQVAADFRRTAGGLVSSIQNTAQYTPAVLKPIKMLYTGRTSFFGSEVNRKWEEDLPAAMQTGPDVNPMADALGQITGPTMGITPRELDAMPGEIGGSLLAYAWAAAGSVARLVGDYPAGESLRLKDTMLVRRFAINEPGRQPQNDYYEFLEELDEVEAIIAHSLPSDQAHIKRENALLLSAKKKMKPIRSALSKLYKRKQAIMRDKELTRSQMSEKLSENREQHFKLMKRAQIVTDWLQAQR